MRHTSNPSLQTFNDPLTIVSNSLFGDDDHDDVTATFGPSKTKPDLMVSVSNSHKHPRTSSFSRICLYHEVAMFILMRVNPLVLNIDIVLADMATAA